LVFKFLSRTADKLLGNTSPKKYNKTSNKKLKKRDKKHSKQDKDEFDAGDLQLVSSNKILIKIFKHFGSDTSYLKGKYIATEKRDIYGNLISINDQFKHNEDTDFSIEDVYREMNEVLGFKNKTITERLEIIDIKIKNQDRLMGYLTKFPELNCIYNYPDESLKSRDLIILRNYIKNHDNRGSYFTIEDGLRVYSFESVDGVLVPIWHGVDTYTQNPDHTRKTKVNIQEDQRMRKEMALFNREKKLGNVLITALIFCMILFVVLLFASYKVWEKNDQIEARIHASTFKCTDYVSSMANSLLKIDNTEIMQSYIKTEDNIKPPEPETKDLSPEKVFKTLK